MKNEIIVLGAGITGLSAGYKKNIPVYEATTNPGGICASYYVGLDGKIIYSRDNEETYRFEIGGGHWIFGADDDVAKFINSICPTKFYQRKSSVYFPDLNLFVPYPIQNHLFYLPEKLRKKALEDILQDNNKLIVTLADWLEASFGKTLCDNFFFPFHELYTAGLYKTIAPQDQYKSPVKKELIIKGASQETTAVGYNTGYFYPEPGLNGLMQGMAKECQINYGKRVTNIDVKSKTITFGDDSYQKFNKIISTLPLNKMLDMCGLKAGQPDPYSSVLVINIGAQKGKNCPEDHWIYIPDSKAKFHRVGFYSNVDVSFLPKRSRAQNDCVSIYVEKGYPPGEKPSEQEIRQVSKMVVEELKSWDMISQEEVVSPTWVEVAYTWHYPNSTWPTRAIEELRKYQIQQTGRYGKWKFQGISDSIKDGWKIHG